MNDILVDITMTATRRPSILIKTLDSFYSNMFKPIIDRCRIIINVDPVGDDIQSCELSKIIEIYFERYIIGMPREASFPRAFNWCWNHIEAPWIFHLEDDWELMQNVDVLAMIKCMEDNQDLAALRLSMFPAGETPIDMMKNWNRWVPWCPQAGIYKIKEEERHRIGVCGHPTMFRHAFVKNTLPLMDPEKNPEKQFQGPHREMMDEMMQWCYGVYAKPGDPPAIRDIGREWMAKNNFHKIGNKAFFTNWGRSDG